MSFYANITLQGPEQDEVVAFLKARGLVAYVSPPAKGCTVVFHEDLGSQEPLAAGLSSHFRCPALLVMGYGEAVLLYQLYAAGERVDAYVSPHEEVYEGLDDTGEPRPQGNAVALCEAFGMDLPHQVAKVERILRRPGKPNTDYGYAVNRHGELARALGLPLFAAGAGYGAIEMGELPEGQGFDVAQLVKTGS